MKIPDFSAQGHWLVIIRANTVGDEFLNSCLPPAKYTIKTDCVLQLYYTEDSSKDCQ
jgi:hypothetical protein